MPNRPRIGKNSRHRPPRPSRRRVIAELIDEYKALLGETPEPGEHVSGLMPGISRPIQAVMDQLAPSA